MFKEYFENFLMDDEVEILTKLVKEEMKNVEDKDIYNSILRKLGEKYE